MADQRTIVPAKPVPDLNIPDSSSTVNVRIIDTTSYGTAAASLVFTPKISGLDTFKFPSFAFLITNESLDKHVLFDLGMSKDWERFIPPPTVEWIKQYMPFTVDQNIDEILDSDPGNIGITTRDISSIFWSHHHFDHRGDISHFPKSTELILGPGFLQAYSPAYPTNPASSINESELQGRPVRELDPVKDFRIEIGGFPAHDFFGDGSLYILSSPGHTVGHLCSLARLTNGFKPTFVFIGADCCHHPAIFRPSAYLPIPEEIPAIPESVHGIAPCLGQWMVDLAHPEHAADVPFMKANTGVNEDQALAEASIASMQQFDAHEEILVCIAHDSTLIGNLDFYPKTLNEWQKQGRKDSLRWQFCGQFDVKIAERT